MLIDIKKCNGCYSCFLACRDEYCGNDYPGYSAAQPLSGQFWIHVQEIERGEYPKPKIAYIPKPCLHCEAAPCLNAGKDGAIYRRPDGIVMIDPVKAKGQEAIAKACPYRVIYWNAELQIPQKCTLCAHRLDDGEKLPRCVESCPTGAMVFGDLDDPKSEIAQLAASLPVEDLHPEFGTKPLVRYVGIPQRFVAGEVVFADKEGECAEGVRVTLTGGGLSLAAATDLFGDFEFEGLKQNEKYQVKVAAAGYKDRSLELVTRKDINLGEIVLERK
jgi:Fe-S-cluster-containing dehydrogenase component